MDDEDRHRQMILDAEEKIQNLSTERIALNEVALRLNDQLEGVEEKLKEVEERLSEAIRRISGDIDFSTSLNDALSPIRQSLEKITENFYFLILNIIKFQCWV